MASREEMVATLKRRRMIAELEKGDAALNAKQPAKPPAKERTAMEYASETASNILPSLGKSATGYANLVAHPYEAYKSMIDLGQGIITKGMDKVPPEYQRQSDMASGVGKSIAKRYGGLDNIADTLRTDPVGFVEDASMVFGLAPGKVGKFARAADPLNATANMATALPKKAMKAGALKAMESATGFSGRVEDPRKLAQIMLDDRLTVSREGMQRHLDIKNKLDVDRKALLDGADATGTRFVPFSDVLKPLEGLRKQHSGMGATNSKKALKDIDRVQAEYLYGKAGKVVKPTELNQNKTAWASDVYDSTRPIGNRKIDSRYALEAKNALANKARDDLATLAPGLEQVNAQLGPRIALTDELKRAVYASEKAPIIPMNSPLRMLAGAQLGGKAAAVMGGASGQLGKAGAKSKLALKMDSIGDFLEWAMKNGRTPQVARGAYRYVDEERQKKKRKSK